MDQEDVTREERVEIVHEFLADQGIALPTKVIYRNLKTERRFTVGEESLRLYLDELREKGYIKRVDPKAMEVMEIVELPPDEGRAYYRITEAGASALDSG